MKSKYTREAVRHDVLVGGFKFTEFVSLWLTVEEERIYYLVDRGYVMYCSRG